MLLIGVFAMSYWRHRSLRFSENFSHKKNAKIRSYILSKGIAISVNAQFHPAVSSACHFVESLTRNHCPLCCRRRCCGGWSFDGVRLIVVFQSGGLVAVGRLKNNYIVFDLRVQTPEHVIASSATSDAKSMRSILKPTTFSVLVANE